MSAPSTTTCPRCGFGSRTYGSLREVGLLVTAPGLRWCPMCSYEHAARPPPDTRRPRLPTAPRRRSDRRRSPRGVRHKRHERQLALF